MKGGRGVEKEQTGYLGYRSHGHSDHSSHSGHSDHSGHSGHSDHSSHSGHSGHSKLRSIDEYSILREPRMRDEPFDPDSPRGRKHGRVFTSTGKGKARSCDVSRQVLQHKNLTEKLKTLHTIAEVCIRDYYDELLPNYVKIFSKGTSDEVDADIAYQENSNAYALERAQKVYRVLSASLEAAEKGGHDLVDEDIHKLVTIKTRLGRMFPTFKVIAGISGDEVKAIPFHLG